MSTIKITSGGKTISIESDNAGVPDVTEGTGPDMIKLQDDAMAAPTATNAEFDAAEPIAATEKEDTMQAVEKANESFFDAIFGCEDGIEEPAAAAPAAEEKPAPEGDVCPECGKELENEENGEGAGEVSEADGVTTIDTGDTVITITNTDDDEKPAEEPAPAAADADPETTTDNADPAAAGNEEQAIESFFRNLGL